MELINKQNGIEKQSQPTPPSFSNVYGTKHMVDVTLSCEGELIQAHKLILAMNSTYFREMFQKLTCQNPVVVLTGMSSRTLRNVLNYIYTGEVLLNKDDLTNFLDASKFLGVSGVLKKPYLFNISSVVIKDGRGVTKDIPEAIATFDKKMSSHNDVFGLQSVLQIACKKFKSEGEKLLQDKRHLEEINIPSALKSSSFIPNSVDHRLEKFPFGENDDIAPTVFDIINFVIEMEMKIPKE